MKRSLFVDFWLISKPLKSNLKEVYSNKETESNLVNTIKIFCINQNRYFGLAKNSGIFFEMSGKAYKELDSAKRSKNYTFSKEIVEQLNLLAKMGVFSKPETHKEQKYIDRVNINLCHECNLHCKYCFAEGGSYGLENGKMNEKTAKNTIDEFIDQLPSGKSGNIILFGGEPLLNLDLANYIIEYCEKKAYENGNEIVYDFFTNGTLINENIMEIMKRKDNIRILLSLDGPPYINNKFRESYREQDVTSIIENNLKYIKPFMDRRVVVRCTIGWVKRDLIERIAYFVDLGFKNIVIDPAYCENIEGIDKTSEIWISLIDQLEDVTNFLISKIKEGKKININLISEMVGQILRNGKDEKIYESYQCPGGSKYIAVDCSGDIYPCHFFVGNQEWAYCNVNQSTIQQRNIVQNNGIRNLEKEVDAKCSTCDLKSICEGPCPYKRLVLFPNSTDVQDEICRYMNIRVLESLRLISEFYNKDNMPYKDYWEVYSRYKMLHGEKNEI